MIKISAILLGAGESKRMGANKLLLPWKKKTILQHCFDTLVRSNVKEVVVVLGGRTKGMENQFKGRKVKVIMNPHYKRGMSTSMRRGIQVMDPRSEGILLAFGDMPFLIARTINSLIEKFAQGKGGIIVPSFEGIKGHPVIFHKRYKEELLKLEGDVGGRSIIEKYPNDLRLIRVRSQGVVKDIDTWRDYLPAPSSA